MAMLTTQRNAKSPTLTEKLKMIVLAHLVKELLTYPAVVELVKPLTTRPRVRIFYFSFRPGLVGEYRGYCHCDLRLHGMDRRWHIGFLVFSPLPIALGFPQWKQSGILALMTVSRTRLRAEGPFPTPAWREWRRSLTWWRPPLSRTLLSMECIARRTSAVDFRRGVAGVETGPEPGKARKL